MTDAKYRSVYLPVVRDEEPRSLEVFDFAEPSMVVGTRESSNTANQALYMMNNPFVIGQSEALASRVVEGSLRVADQIESAFMLVYGRPPSGGERRAAATFFNSFSAATPPGAGQFGAGQAAAGQPPQFPPRRFRAGQFRAGQFRAGRYVAGGTETLTAFCQSLFAAAEFRYID